MRNPPRHLAKRFELLGLAQRILGLPLFGPVEQGRDRASVFGGTMKNLNRFPIFLALDKGRFAGSLDLQIECAEMTFEFVDIRGSDEILAFGRTALCPLAA